MTRAVAWHLIAATIGAVILMPYSSPAEASNKPLPKAETPIKPESHPPGDIPDNQAFIRYGSPKGYTIEVPEGWARRSTAHGVIYADKYDSIALTVSQRTQPLTLSSAKQIEIPKLKKTGRAIRISAVKSVALPSGSAVMVRYGSNSEPNPVTNKAIRLENDRYLFWNKGKLVSLTLSAPYGADNVDQWRRISRSFRWR